MDIVPSLLDLASFSALVVGLTGMVAKFLREEQRDRVLPLAAIIIGIVLNVLPVLLPENAVLIASYNGLLIGGMATGWVSIVKPKQNPDLDIAAE